jgi:hypothetical protein
VQQHLDQRKVLVIQSRTVAEAFQRVYSLAKCCQVSTLERQLCACCDLLLLLLVHVVGQLLADVAHAAVFVFAVPVGAVFLSIVALARWFITLPVLLSVGRSVYAYHGFSPFLVSPGEAAAEQDAHV